MQVATAPAPAIESPSVVQLPPSSVAPSVSTLPLEPAPIAVAEAAPIIESEVPTLVAVPSTDGLRLVAGKVIIRRGDTLWSISRRVYGEGVRYSVIFRANASQIRDPNRIYPGQVFDLPAMPR